MQATITLNTEAGNLPAWAEQEATRLSKLNCFTTKNSVAGWAAVRRSLKAKLSAVGFSDRVSGMIADEIMDLAQLKAASN